MSVITLSLLADWRAALAAFTANPQPHTIRARKAAKLAYLASVRLGASA